MKSIKRCGFVVAVAMLNIATINAAQAEPTSYEWSSTTGFISSTSQNAIETVTGQSAFPVSTPNGVRWVTPGSMSGTFDHDPDNADPPIQFGNFTHYVGASLASISSLSSEAGLIGTIVADLGRVIVSDSGGGLGGNQDVVNVNACCATGLTFGPWTATSNSVVWVGEGFQNDQELPTALPPPGAPQPIAIFSFFNTATGENASINSINVNFREAIQTVEIDVKPGSDPNCFNINGHGVIPVAILGSEDLDVSNIDQVTVSFGGLDVRVRGNKYPQCSGEYSNSDQYLDLVCHFQDDSSAWIAGGDEATLTGALLDGSKFQGNDSICLVP